MNQTTELIANQPAATRAKKGDVVNNCAAEPANVQDAELLQPVKVNLTYELPSGRGSMPVCATLVPRVMLNPRLVYATDEEWAEYETVKRELAQFADDLNTTARIECEQYVTAFESRGIILRTRTSKARIDNLLAYDLCDNTANRTACEGALVNRATTSKRITATINEMGKFADAIKQHADKRAAAKRAADIAKAQAYLAKLGLSAADLA